MKITIPQIKKDHQATYLSANIVTDTHRPLPESLWFSVRRHDDRLYTLSSDPFLIAMVPIAMRLRENLSVDGPVSTKLAFGIQQYQNFLSDWFPTFFQPIHIEYQQLTLNQPHATHTPQGAGCCFSGGVDAFYTLLKHAPNQEPLEDYRITHALMINGFDQFNDFEPNGSSQRMYDIYQPILEKWQITLLLLDSNLKKFRSAVFRESELVLSLSSPLSACAHVCQTRFNKLYIAGHGTCSNLGVWGSHPALDHYLSSDHMQILHETDSNHRSAKIASIIKHEVVKKNLRVCFGPLTFDQKNNRVTNCGRCEKCIRTIVALYLLGIIDECETFSSRQPIEYYQSPKILAASHRIFLLSNLKQAKERGLTQWAVALEKAIRYQMAMQNRGKHQPMAAFSIR